ncbi:MAG: PEP-CTERM sorting domain-containing protein [Crocosphaera sp.]|nr:PEP-CTERM sorting domain-containing protein [Crocosphaera sp.]
MNNKILNLLGMLGVTVGITTATTAAQASTFGPGGVSFTSEAGIFFNNNAIITINDPPAPLSPGNSRVTTPENPIDGVAGIFGIVPGDPNTYPPIFPIEGLASIDEVLQKLDGRQFTVRDPFDPVLASNILTNDLGFTIAAIGALEASQPGSTTCRGDNRICNNVTYDLTFGGAVDVTTLPAFLEFDTDGDGQYGEASGVGDNPLGDFKYFATAFTRIVEERDPGAFEVTLDFEGFFVDMEGNFKDTPSIVSLFTGVTSVDPEDLPASDDPPTVFQAGINGAITTEGRPPNVPEPGTIIGLTALAGLGLGSRLKHKGK